MLNLKGEYFSVNVEIEDTKVIVPDGDLKIDLFGKLVRAVFENDEGCGVLEGSINSFSRFEVQTFEVDVTNHGIGTYIFKSLVDEFNFDMTCSHLVGCNYLEFDENIKAGFSIEEALLMMPAVKIRRRVGFRFFEFDFISENKIYMEAYR